MSVDPYDVDFDDIGKRILNHLDEHLGQEFSAEELDKAARPHPYDIDVTLDMLDDYVVDGLVDRRTSGGADRYYRSVGVKY